MNFFIKKNSTLPILKMELINDGRHTYNNFYELIQKSIVTFSMKNKMNNQYVILNSEALILPKKDSTIEEYYIAYKFKERDTKTIGEYIGEFNILGDDGLLITPIIDDLNITIK